MTLTTAGDYNPSQKGDANMRFSSGAISKASFRQYDGQGMGTPCAKCGEYLDMLAPQEQSWFAIPRMPVEKGGKTADNCIVVCPKCFDLIGQDGTKTIPYGELPHYR